MKFIYQEEVDTAREIMDIAKKSVARDKRKKRTEEEIELDERMRVRYEEFFRELMSEYHNEWEQYGDEEGLGVFLVRIFTLGVLSVEPKDSKYYKGMGFK